MKENLLKKQFSCALSHPYLLSLALHYNEVTTEKIDLYEIYAKTGPTERRKQDGS